VKFNRLATLEHRTLPDDPLSSQAVAWTEYRTAWISLEPLGGREPIQAQQIKGEVSHRIRMEFYSDVVPLDRLKIRNGVVIGDTDNPADDRFYRIFQIDSVLNFMEQNREMQLLCKEQV
jgi:SPP1 family predicted phage head-tail adaptor